MKNILSAALLACAAALFAAPASATDVGFVLGAGVLGVSGSGTAAFTHAHGTQSGGGVSFGKTEVSANAASDFRLGTNVGFGANMAANTASSSVSGSLVNGNGSASNVTFGGGVAGAGLAGVVGGGASFHH